MAIEDNNRYVGSYPPVLELFIVLDWICYFTKSHPGIPEKFSMLLREWLHFSYLSDETRSAWSEIDENHKWSLSVLWHALLFESSSRLVPKSKSFSTGRVSLKGCFPKRIWTIFATWRTKHWVVQCNQINRNQMVNRSKENRVNLVLVRNALKAYKP